MEGLSEVEILHDTNSALFFLPIRKKEKRTSNRGDPIVDTSLTKGE
jgi:hypothetical protein